MQNKYILLMVFFAVVVFVSACYHVAQPQSEPEEVTPTPEVTPPEVTKPEVTEEAPTGEVVEITVEGSEFSFDPSQITVNEGDTVRVTFRNTGTIIHNWGLPEFGRTSTIGGGQTDTIEFVADQTGTFNFWCSVSGHRGRGMEGQITIQ